MTKPRIKAERKSPTPDSLQAVIKLFLHIWILVATNHLFPGLLCGQQAEAVHLEVELCGLEFRDRSQELLESQAQ